MRKYEFGTSGIRGLFGTEVDVRLAMELGSVLIEKPGWRVVIGRDTRTTGQALEMALAAGVLSAGGVPVAVGIAPIPTTALAAKNHGNAGVMITASHNPPEYNGFKLFNGKGEEVGPEREREIEQRLRAGEFNATGWEAVQAAESIDCAVREHIDLVLSLIDTKAIERKRPKVVVDCGNGAASVIMPYVLREAGARVIAVNAEPSGFFNRGLEPNEENLGGTAAIARAVGADMAIAHDGDADRAVILDEKGEMLGLDAQLAMMCEEVLKHRKGKIVSTIEASLLVKERVEKAGGKLLITKVGSLNCARLMRRSGAIFAGEPCGEYIFTGGVPLPDGVLTGLKFVEYLCHNGRLGARRERFKVYPMKRAKYPAKDKKAAMERIKDEVRAAFEGKLFEEDGIRVDMEDGWLLVRASGTEPVIRITAEHRRRDGLAKLFRKAEAIVKKYT